MVRRLLSGGILVLVIFVAACSGDAAYETEAAQAPSMPVLDMPQRWEHPLDDRLPIDEALQIVEDFVRPFHEAQSRFIAPGLWYGEWDAENPYALAVSPDYDVQTTEDIRNAFRLVFTDSFVDTVIENLLFDHERPFYLEIDGLLHRLAADFPTLWSWVAEDAKVGMFTDSSFVAFVYDARYWMLLPLSYAISFELTGDGWRIGSIEMFHGGVFDVFGN